MNPSSIKAYLKRRGMAPMSDLVNRFDGDADAVRGVLEFWKRKGRVREIEPQAGCSGGCSGCSRTACGALGPDASVYAWVDLEEEKHPMAFIRHAS